MSPILEDLEKIYAEWPSEELHNELSKNRHDYTPEAVNVIEQELKKRGLGTSIKCPKCGLYNPSSSNNCDCGYILQILPSEVLSPAFQQSFRSLRVNKKISDEDRCAICSGPMVLGEEIVQCERCFKYFHSKCKDSFGGCNTPECQVQRKKCPFCKELINQDAIKCRYCGEYVDETVRQSTVPKGTPSEANEALKYAIFGIFCFGVILGPVAISKGLKALKIIDSEPGYTGRGKAKAGIIIGIIVTLLWAIGFLEKIKG